MKKVLLSLLVLVALFTITGCSCSKEKESSAAEEKIPNGDIVLVCKRSDNFEDVNIEATNTYNFGKNQYIISLRVDTVYKFTDDEQFNINSEEIKNTANEIKSIKNTVYEYNIDENSKTITTLFGYTKMDISDEAKDDYSIKTLISDNEINGLTCELTGITREELK